MSGWAAHDLLGPRPWDGPASDETFVRVLSAYALGHGREPLDRRLPGLSTIDLQERCDLSRPSVSALVERFAPVLDAQAASGQPVAAGATARRWALRTDLGCYLALDVGGRRTGVAAFDLAGRRLSSSELSSPGENPDATIGEAVEWFRKVTDGDRVVGIGVSVAAPVDPRRGVRGFGGRSRPGAAKRWEDWQRTSVIEQLRDLIAVDAPIALDNDANVSALAEYVWGAAAPSTHGNRPRYSNVIYIKWSRGIGVGMILGGKLFRGEGIAGEIGHTTVTPDQSMGRCANCGRFGCLETVAGSDAILHGRRSMSIEQAVDLASDPRTPEAEAFRQAAGKLAIALGPLINLLNPQLVIIGGEIGSRAYPVVRDALRDALVKTTLGSTLADVSVVSSRLDDAALRGAALLLAPLSEQSPWLLRFLRRSAGIQGR